jgi:hypothetical protein
MRQFGLFCYYCASASVRTWLCVIRCGVIYKLSPGPKGKWTCTVLHTFGIGNDGGVPEGNLVMDGEATCTAAPCSAAPTVAAWYSNSRRSS